VTGGTLQPVLETLKTVHESRVHLEIVNLMVPTYNDDPDTIRKMCEWIKENIGVEHPIHFTRFHPMFKLEHLPATPISTIEKATVIARDVGLQYVYVGNVPGHELESTFCPKCHTRLIYRVGFQVLDNKIKDGKCPQCGQAIPGVW
jgi:pyruvate formate lyase activating enzyme